MVNNNQSFTIQLEPGAIREIEQIVDLVCDQLFINDTYYGSILMAMTELFGVLLEQQSTKTFKIEYNTDYQEVTFSFYPVDKKITSAFELQVNIDTLEEPDAKTSVFLIKSLVDDLTVTDNEVIHLSFDISALHNKVYEQRRNQLKKYFNVNQELKVNKKDDQL
ncbi:MAG: hypothetical protein L3J31_02205 [Bacteroidales bacterium]|nr:hypothetical protein [Bacteroidales bacterium]MCF6341604.1 hypothetical protein [Bacteroidales bacterium]